MKTREQLLQDIGEAVRELTKIVSDKGMTVHASKMLAPHFSNVEKGIEALAEFEYEQLQEEE